MEKDLVLWNCRFLHQKTLIEASHSFLVAEKAQQHSVVLCQEKKGRENNLEVVVVALWFPVQTSSAGAQSCWWCPSLLGDPSVTRYTKLI